MKPDDAQNEEVGTASDQRPKSPIRELESGIFNMVITLTKQLESVVADRATARDYVANYLQRLADSLRSFEEEEPKEGQTDDEPT